jgi:hypothetical protein
MGNGKLIYGINITKTQFLNLYKTLCNDNNENEEEEEGEEDFPDNESENDPENVSHFNKFGEEMYILNTKLLTFEVSVFKNGGCCLVDTEYPFFIGWESCAIYRGDVWKKISMIDESVKQNIDNFLLVHFSKHIPNFYLLQADCDFCT